MRIKLIKKQLMSIILAGAMTFALLSGCGASSTTDEDTLEAITEEDEAYEASVEYEDEGDEADEAEAEDGEYAESDALYGEADASDGVEVLGDVLVTDIEPVTMYVNATSINVRALPNTDSDVVGMLRYGNAVTANGVTDTGWYRVVFDSAAAYISASLLQTEALEEQQAATSTVGKTYTNELCTGLAKEIFDETNKQRAAIGVDPLIWDDELARCANIRAEEIVSNFSHTRADGTKCYALSDLIWGENLAKGPHATGAEFLEHWMASPGHAANLLDSRYKTIGVGTYRTATGDYAVQLFGIG